MHGLGLASNGYLTASDGYPTFHSSETQAKIYWAHRLQAAARMPVRPVPADGLGREIARPRQHAPQMGDLGQWHSGCVRSMCPVELRGRDALRARCRFRPIVPQR
jgi:hypothetical protein